MNHQRLRFAGITIIELLIVVAIMGLLIVATTIGIRQHLVRANDAERKSDLKKISTALEQYYNDHNGYPVTLDNSGLATSLISCGTNTVLNPYMKNVPCDPNAGTAQPYLYIPTVATRIGSRGEIVRRGYRLLTSLTYKADPQIQEVGCPSELGCGGYKADGIAVVPAIYNFGLAANAQVNMTP